MEESCKDMLKKIYDTGAKCIPQLCHDIVHRAFNKTNPVDEIECKLTFFIFNVMNQSLKAGIELGNNSVTKENFKEWFDLYAKDTIITGIKQNMQNDN